MSAVAYFRISKGNAQQILREVEQAVSNWRVEGRSLGMSEIELEQFADAFEHYEREVARRTFTRS